ncbi:MAG: hypothetical protein JW776_14205 [Candidatus Lokiarchaeota archaeon]|nr:hypothetical protein [Candidatus Lokiarchaeota archaeon]
MSDPIFQKYPNASRVKNREYHLQIPLTKDVSIFINFKRYPYPPNVKLVKESGERFRLTTVLSHLRDWNVKEPFSLVSVIDEVFLLVESIINRQIPFTESCFQGLIDICKENHPRKIQGVLSVHQGKVSQLIIPAIECSEPENRINYVNFQSMCVLPFDLSYEGTFISRPDGNLSINRRLNRVFRKRRFTMLLGHPYDNPENVRLFDRDGRELSYVILSNR